MDFSLRGNFLGNDPDHSNESTEERLKRFALEEDVINGIDLALRLAPPQPWPLVNAYTPWAQKLGHVEEAFFTIKKDLDDSDVGRLGRMWLRKEMVERFVEPHLTAEERREVAGGGLRVVVRDVDTRTERWLVLKSRNNRSYTLGSNWMKEFVCRRLLCAGDRIGMFWDGHSRCFCFSVLRRADPCEIPLPYTWV